MRPVVDERRRQVSLPTIFLPVLFDGLLEREDGKALKHVEKHAVHIYKQTSLKKLTRKLDSIQRR